MNFKTNDNNYENLHFHFKLTATTKIVVNKLAQEAFSLSSPVLEFDVTVAFSFAFPSIF